MSAPSYPPHPPCVICLAAMRPDRGERPEFYAARKVCSAACRCELRSRTMLAKAAGRLADAVAEWSPGCSVARLAQRHGVKAGKLRQRLLELGHKPKPAEPRAFEAPKDAKPRKRGQPPTDHLLAALVRTYGARSAPVRAVASNAGAAVVIPAQRQVAPGPS